VSAESRPGSSSLDAEPGTCAKVPERVSSEALLGRRRELVIVHNGREYRLRLTQNGKLILTA
jgi:hemin uptake protein HemP